MINLKIVNCFCKLSSSVLKLVKSKLRIVYRNVYISRLKLKLKALAFEDRPSSSLGIFLLDCSSFLISYYFLSLEFSLSKISFFFLVFLFDYSFSYFSSFFFYNSHSTIFSLQNFLTKFPILPSNRISLSKLFFFKFRKGPPQMRPKGPIYRQNLQCKTCATTVMPQPVRYCRGQCGCRSLMPRMVRH